MLQLLAASVEYIEAIHKLCIIKCGRIDIPTTIYVAAKVGVPFWCDKSLRTTAEYPRIGSRDQGGIEAHGRWIVQSR